MPRGLRWAGMRMGMVPSLDVEPDWGIALAGVHAVSAQNL